MYAQREPAFSVGQLLILHVKSMFGKYRRRLLHRVPHTEVSLLRGNRKVVFTEIAGGHVLTKCAKERHSPPPLEHYISICFQGVTASL